MSRRSRTSSARTRRIEAAGQEDGFHSFMAASCAARTAPACMMRAGADKRGSGMLSQRTPIQEAGTEFRMQHGTGRNSQRLLVLAICTIVMRTFLANADPLPPDPDSSAARTTTAPPQVPEDRRGASGQSQLPITQDPGDQHVVHTTTIRPQTSEELRDVSRHSLLPLTHNPTIEVPPNPDRHIVRTIRVPSQWPQQ
jgi:hypothetical protein